MRMNTCIVGVSVLRVTFAKKPNAFNMTDFLPSTDDPHVFEDAPVGLQLVGRTHEEEAVLAMTEVVDNALKRASVSS
jgi:Asp-tRNA(Asn)/Glu-tRNA(Gln) amidotransferase A subunit family amidase